MQCVIWTNPGGGLCNLDRCYKWQYLYRALGKCFIGYIYRNIVQYCTITVYEYDTIRIGTLAHAFWVRVPFPEVQSLGEAGRTDAARVFIGALFKRTATTTQAGTGSPTLRSGTVALNLCVAPLMSRIYCICISQGDYRNVSCRGEHNMQGTSTLWVN